MKLMSKTLQSIARLSLASSLTLVTGCASRDGSAKSPSTRAPAPEETQDQATKDQADQAASGGEATTPQDAKTKKPPTKPTVQGTDGNGTNAGGSASGTDPANRPPVNNAGNDHDPVFDDVSSLAYHLTGQVLDESYVVTAAQGTTPLKGKMCQLGFAPGQSEGRLILSVGEASFSFAIANELVKKSILAEIKAVGKSKSWESFSNSPPMHAMHSVSQIVASRQGQTTDVWISRSSFIASTPDLASGAQVKQALDAGQKEGIDSIRDGLKLEFKGKKPVSISYINKRAPGVVTSDDSAQFKTLAEINCLELKVR